MMPWWQNLSERDRRTLMGGGVLALLLLGYALVWAPLSEARAQWRDRAVAADQSVRWMKQASALIDPARVQAGNPGDNRSLLARIDATAREAGLAGALLRVEPVTPQQVRAQFQSAPFDTLTDWLARLKREQAIAVDDFSIRRAAGSGMVDARITVSSAGP